MISKAKPSLLAIATCVGLSSSSFQVMAQDASSRMPAGEGRLVRGPVPIVAEPLPILSMGGSGHYYYDAMISEDRTEIAFIMQEEGTHCIQTMSIGEKRDHDSGYISCGFPGGDGDPCYSSADGRLYFTSAREFPDGRGLVQTRIWYSERDASGAWSENPTLLDLPESGDGAWSLSVTNDGDLWYENDEASLYRTGTMLRSRSVDGRHGPPDVIDILPPGLARSPAVAPDGSYIVFNARSAANEDDRDLFVVLRLEGGEWSDPLSLGEAVNSDREERYARVSADGSLLVFCRLVPEPYVPHAEYYQLHWVDVELMISSLNPEGD